MSTQQRFPAVRAKPIVAIGLSLVLSLVLVACANSAGRTPRAGATSSPPASAARPSVLPSQSAMRATPPSAAGAETPVPVSARHVYLIVLENKDYASIVGSDAAPFITSLAQRYASATNYHATTHPSQPNYIALFSGSTHGIEDNGIYRVDAPNLADQLEDAGLTWRVYAENVPTDCYPGATASGGADGPGTYARKHNPAISFVSISGRPERCANITDFSHFDPGAANFSFIVPNLCHDMHDCSVTDGDDWLRSFVPRITESAAYANGGLVLITFDEGRGDGNQVATIAISSAVSEGTESDRPYDHYSLLRTVQQLFGLPCLANSCDATPMTDLLGG